jgi:hypothetical protein
MGGTHLAQHGVRPLFHTFTEGESVMETSRLILAAAAAFVPTVPVTYAQDGAAVASESVRAPGPRRPWKHVRGFGRVLDLSKPPVVIDEPGLYAVDRNWRFTAATMDGVAELITITAEDVTFDLHGFTISAEAGTAPPSTLLILAGDDAEVRNGSIETSGIDAALRSASRGAWLHHLAIRTGDENPRLQFADFTTISDSRIAGIMWLTADSSLERSTLGGLGRSITLTGNGNRVIENHIGMSRGDTAVVIEGVGNLVANNVLDGNSTTEIGFGVEGDANVLRGNTIVELGSGTGTVMQISGTGNTLDGNIALPLPDARATRIGIEFTANGNYYGNNRISAEVPFVLGGTTQTDWGGNVAY